jgi:hypothetical protein
MLHSVVISYICGQALFKLNQQYRDGFLTIDETALSFLVNNLLSLLNQSDRGDRFGLTIFSYLEVALTVSKLGTTISSFCFVKRL